MSTHDTASVKPEWTLAEVQEAADGLDLVMARLFAKLGPPLPRDEQEG